MCPPAVLCRVFRFYPVRLGRTGPGRSPSVTHSAHAHLRFTHAIPPCNTCEFCADTLCNCGNKNSPQRVRKLNTHSSTSSSGHRGRSNPQLHSLSLSLSLALSLSLSLSLSLDWERTQRSPLSLSPSPLLCLCMCVEETPSVSRGKALSQPPPLVFTNVRGLDLAVVATVARLVRIKLPGMRHSFARPEWPGICRVGKGARCHSHKILGSECCIPWLCRAICQGGHFGHPHNRTLASFRCSVISGSRSAVSAVPKLPSGKPPRRPLQVEGCHQRLNIKNQDLKLMQTSFPCPSLRIVLRQRSRCTLPASFRTRTLCSHATGEHRQDTRSFFRSCLPLCPQQTIRRVAGKHVLSKTLNRDEKVPVHCPVLHGASQCEA